MLAAVFVVHARTLGFGFTYLDDTELIVDRLPFLIDWSSLGTAFTRSYFGHGADAYYRPLVTVSYALDAHWSGAHPFGYHFTNLLLHCAASVLVLFLLLRFRFGEPAAIFAAALFAVHPALVETVAWIPGRNDLLLTVFALGAWLLVPEDGARTLRAKFGHATCFLCALLTKETAVVLPLVYAAHVTWMGGWRTLARTRWLWASWAGALTVYFVARLAVVASPHISIAARLATVVKHAPALVSSVGKLVLLADLAVIAVPEDTSLWPGVVSIFGLAGVSMVAKGVRREVLLVAAAAMAIPLLPATLASEHLVLENRLYLPAVGLSFFVAELCRAIFQNGPHKHPAPAIVLLSGALLAWKNEGAFRDRAAFTEAAVRESPDSALAHLQRGVFENQVEHDTDAAEREFRRTAEIDPTEPLVQNNLGVLLLDTGRFTEAEARFRAELATNPKSSLAHYNLGLALSRENHPEAAVPEWEQTLEVDPDQLDAMGELFAYYSRTGDAAKARHYADDMSRLGARLITSGTAR